MTDRDMADKPSKPDLEQMRADRQRAQRAGDDALATLQEVGQTRANLQRDLAESDRTVEQHLRVLRRARIL